MPEERTRGRLHCLGAGLCGGHRRRPRRRAGYDRLLEPGGRPNARASPAPFFPSCRAAVSNGKVTALSRPYNQMFTHAGSVPKP